MKNTESVHAYGKGLVAFQTTQGTKLVYDVLYVPCLTCNLSSVGQMMCKGYSLFFKGNHCLILTQKIV